MWAAEDKQFDATQLLIEQGANVHIRDEVRLLLKNYKSRLESTYLPRLMQTRVTVSDSKAA